MSNRRAQLYYLLICCIWGSTWLSIKLGLAVLPPLWFVSSRFVVATLVFFLLLKLLKKSLRITRKELPIFFQLGLLMYALPYTLVFWGEQYVSSATAALITSVYPLLTFPLAYFLKVNEKFSWNKFFGMIFGFVGVLFFILPNFDWHDLLSIRGELALFGSTLLAAWNAVNVRRLRHIPTHQITFYPILFATGMLLAVSFFKGDWNVFLAGVVQFQGWSNLIYLAVVGTVISFYLYVSLIQVKGVTLAVSTQYVIVPLALLLDHFVMKTPLSPWTFIGVLFVFGGLWFVSHVKKNVHPQVPVL